ncbi:Thioredoxin-like protein [Madurella mycetomatis]|uniref:Thioredoxin-like protein n=1 Tax=Madurella mycetomatis TaxID=100816 RepID=A0A175VRP7_9PEZI|nr:Thioredoxin-like protein [Madurella mycetomatis]
MADPTHIATKEDLKALTSANKIVVLDFWAEWCPPCKAIGPLFSKLAREYAVPGQLAFGKVDVDEVPDITQEFGVTAMPSFLFLVDGEPAAVDIANVGAGGGLVINGDNKVQMIRGADPRALTTVISGLGEAAKKAAENTA